MRKSKRPVEQPRFVFVRDVLPEISTLLKRVLHKIELAAQVHDLRIYGRCPCGGPNCGTFYCVPPDEYKRLLRFGSDGSIDPVTVALGRSFVLRLLTPVLKPFLFCYFPSRATTAYPNETPIEP